MQNHTPRTALKSIVIFFLVSTAVTACDSQNNDSTGKERQIDSEKDPSTVVAREPFTQPTRESVSLEAGGSKFEPPVSVVQIPMGAWMCNMNDSVHFATPQKGGGECPTCGMALVHRMAEGDHSMHDEKGKEHAGH